MSGCSVTLSVASVTLSISSVTLRSCSVTLTDSARTSEDEREQLAKQRVRQRLARCGRSCALGAAACQNLLEI